MQAPDRTDVVSAVWGWIQMHLAVGYLEHCATLDDSSSVSSNLMLSHSVPFDVRCTCAIALTHTVMQSYSLGRWPCQLCRASIIAGLIGPPGTSLPAVLQLCCLPPAQICCLRSVPLFAAVVLHDQSWHGIRIAVRLCESVPSLTVVCRATNEHKRSWTTCTSSQCRTHFWHMDKGRLW